MNNDVTLQEHLGLTTALFHHYFHLKFSDVCAIAQSRCSVDGELFWDPDFLAAVDSDQITYPRFTTAAFGTTDYSSDLGGKELSI